MAPLPTSPREAIVEKRVRGTQRDTLFWEVVAGAFRAANIKHLVSRELIGVAGAPTLLSFDSLVLRELPRCCHLEYGRRGSSRDANDSNDSTAGAPVRPTSHRATNVGRAPLLLYLWATVQTS